MTNYAATADYTFDALARLVGDGTTAYDHEQAAELAAAFWDAVQARDAALRFHPDAPLTDHDALLAHLYAETDTHVRTIINRLGISYDGLYKAIDRLGLPRRKGAA
jgi:hypothetical protein